MASGYRRATRRRCGTAVSSATDERENLRLTLPKSWRKFGATMRFAAVLSSLRGRFQSASAACSDRSAAATVVVRGQPSLPFSSTVNGDESQHDGTTSVNSRANVEKGLLFSMPFMEDEDGEEPLTVSCSKPKSPCPRNPSATVCRCRHDA